MIQIYAKKSDLIYSEPEEFYQEGVDALKPDIKKNGIKMALMVKPNGYVCRGNTRAQASEEDFVPIDLAFFIGLCKANWEGKTAVTLRADVWKELRPNYNNGRYPVKPPNDRIIPLVFDEEKNEFIIDLSDTFMFIPVETKEKE